MYNSLYSGKENVILTTDNVPFGQSQSKKLHLVGMLTNQNQIHIMIHKLIHIFHVYLLNMFAAKCNTNAEGEHSTQPLEKFTMYVWCLHKIGFQMPWWSGRKVEQF